MATARQLYQLQVLELEIESGEQALAQARSQLEDDRELAGVRARLSKERQHLAELGKEQNSLEGEIQDIEAKLAVTQEGLYSGRIKNPKELSGLQHESEILKGKRNQKEEAALGIMERVEAAQADMDSLEREFKEAESRWQIEQQRLTSEIEQMETALSELRKRRRLVLADISPETADLYHRLRKQKGTAVARVERGACCGCRISLSTAFLQRVRGERLVVCDNCGRILFLD